MTRAIEVLKSMSRTDWICCAMFVAGLAPLMMIGG